MGWVDLVDEGLEEELGNEAARSNPADLEEADGGVEEGIMALAVRTARYKVTVEGKSCFFDPFFPDLDDHGTNSLPDSARRTSARTPRRRS